MRELFAARPGPTRRGPPRRSRGVPQGRPRRVPAHPRARAPRAATDRRQSRAPSRGAAATERAPHRRRAVADVGRAQGAQRRAADASRRTSPCTPSWSAPSQRRRAAFEQPGRRRSTGRHAETLAFATLLADGMPIRLTGQDAERGTFSQRHLAFYDAHRRAVHAAAALPATRASFDVHNSPLSENAALGFEYGYSVQAPDALVLWEGAVRRLHQRRAGDRRRVRRLRPGQVGPDLGPGGAAAARLRGPGAGALQRPPGALPAARRRGQPARRQLHHRGAVLLPAAPPGGQPGLDDARGR